MRSSEPTILDDHRNIVPVWTISRSSGSSSDPFERELIIRVGQVAAQRMRRSAWLWALVMPVCMVPIVVWRLPPWSVGAPIVGMLALLYFQTRRAKRSESSRVRATLLSAGRCASCAYPVAHLPPDHDQCVTCPECGAAWTFDPDWSRRANAADAAAAERTGARVGLSSDDQVTVQWLARFFGGLAGRRYLAMTDARGRLVTLFFPRFPWKPPAGWNQVDLAARTQVRREIRAMGWKRRVLLVVALSFPAIMQGSVLVRMPTVSMWGLAQIFTALWVFVFLPLAVFGFLVFPLVRKPEDMASVFLRRGHCPGCATDLKQVALSDDGIRECPHCLAAWKLDGDARGFTVTPGSTSPSHTRPNPPAVPRSE